MREGAAVIEGVGEGAMQGAGESSGVARLLVEDEDRFWPGFVARGRVGNGWFVDGDLGREPLGGDVDTLKRVAAVDIPGDVRLASGFAPAGPLDVLEAGDESGWEGRGGGVCWEVGVAEGAEVGSGDGDCEAGVCFLEVGGEAQFDGVELRVAVDEVQVSAFFVCALPEDGHGCFGLRDGEGGRAGFHDAGFVPGYFFDGAA